ncbi:hydrogenase [Desulfosarcina ovata subsp. sediminis]|uniref:Hydrogenase n=1 Tax=Desulfosarcina ovata subsp. sediminis TaxID=885957 RepID=A0A5K7ZL71_9BACT|nr:proton-conducting transporter membrane subunit [Desulfosarcina ovata]BBO80379.1 hydrogenase [Desulfosarcina ovata subsp. sediminis]
MNLFLLSVLIIVSGGTLAVFLSRQFVMMRWVAVLSIGSGCCMGMLDALSRLISDAPLAFSIGHLSTLGLEFRIDGLSAFFLLAIFGICLMAAVYSFNYLSHAENRLSTAVSYLFFSLLTASMALVVTAANMLTFLLAWELMSLASFFLVVLDYQDPQNRKAGYLYFVFSHVGAMFIIVAFGLIYRDTGSFAFDATALAPPIKLLAFVFAFIGFGSKAGVFPFHVWLPHAHPAAPSHISAVMSGVMIKTGIYGILRMYVILDLHTPATGSLVVIAGVVSGILGVVYALGQHDLKRLLAYHSVENIGIILIGIGIGMIGVATQNPIMAVLGFAGGLLHVLNHAIFKSLLFMGAGMILHKTGTRTIDALGGLLKRMKITGVTFLIGSLAIAGLPPFNGFVSEFLIYLGSFRGIAGNPEVFALSLLAIVGLALIGGLALACFTKVVGVVFQGEPRSPAAEQVDEKGPAMLLPMLILAAGCALIGIYPGAFMFLATKAVASLGLPYGRIPTLPFAHLSANITLAATLFLTAVLFILALRKILYQGKPMGRGGTWGCGFTQPTARMQYTGSSYAGSILEFFKPVAPLQEDHPPVEGLFPSTTHYHSQIHDIVALHLDRFVVAPVVWLFDKLRWIQHGDIHLYIGYILLAIVVLLFFV